MKKTNVATFKQTKKSKNNKYNKVVLYRQLKDMTSVLRLLRTPGFLSVNASSIMAATTFNASSVFSAVNWSNISQEFAEYRVPKLKTYLSPVFNMAYAIPGTNSYPLPLMYCARWWEQLPSATSSIEQSPDCKALSAIKEHSMTTNYEGFPNAQLWTSCASTQSVDKYYGFAFCIPSGYWTTIEPSSGVFNYVIEFYVEFRGVY